jgi:hypothetical protein
MGASEASDLAPANLRASGESPIDYRIQSAGEKTKSVLQTGLRE